LPYLRTPRAGWRQQPALLDIGSAGFMLSTMARRTARRSWPSFRTKNRFFTLRLADLPVQEIDLRFIGRCLRRRVALEDSPQHPAVAFFQLWPRAIIACNRAWIRFECTSKCIANRAMVRSPLIAATTTFALAPRSASFVSDSCPAPALSAFSRGRAPP
jgi:hypothetical protein